jgi:multidrug efflux pump subunit AcrB
MAFHFQRRITLNRNLGLTADLLCAGLAVFAVIVAAIGVFDMVVVSGLTVLLALLICFLPHGA